MWKNTNTVINFDKAIFFLTLTVFVASGYVYYRYRLYQNNIIHRARVKKEEGYIDVYSNKQLLIKLLCMIIFTAVMICLGKLINSKEKK